MESELIIMDRLTVRAGDKVLVGPLDLTVLVGQVIAIMGPSGVGKTSLLHAVIGTTSQLIRTTGLRSGSLAGKDGNRLSTGYAPQGGTLFHWTTVRGNIEYGLKLLPRINRRNRMRELCEGLSLQNDIMDRYPTEVSGGEQQRASLARALAHRPNLLLLDEPFGSLDPALRFKCHDFILRDVKADAAVLIVTHDIEEAVFLADKVLVLEGRPGTVHSIVDITRPCSPRSDWRLSESFNENCAKIRETTMLRS